MRRLLLILLMTLLPLQAGWAAVCAYCPGPCDVAQRREASAAAVQDQDGAVIAADEDCRCCQPGSLPIVPSVPGASAAAMPASFGQDAAGAAPAVLRPERPERPKWPRAA